jgi:hypothetical protein
MSAYASKLEMALWGVFSLILVTGTLVTFLAS